MSRNSSRVLVAFVVTVVAFGLAVVPIPRDDLLTTEVQDALHAVGFAVLTFFVVRAVSHSGPRPWLHAVLGLVFVLLLAVGTEGIQKFTTRDSDPFDFARDLLGIAIGTAAAALPWARSLARRALLVIVVIAGSLATVSPVATTMWALELRRERFPVLHEFEAAWERNFLVARGADLRFEPEGYGRLTLSEGNYPALIVREVPADWTDYDHLCFRIAGEGEVPANLVVRVDDVRHDGTYADRFQRRIGVTAGWTDVMIPLRAIRNGPSGRELDLAAVETLVLFGTPSTPRPLVVRIDALRLE